MFTTTTKEEQKAVDLREYSLKHTHVPTAQKIRQWYNKYKNFWNLEKNVDVSDKGLETLIRLFESETKLQEDVVSSCDEDIPDDAPKISIERSSTITRPQNIVDSNLQKKNESKASDEHCTDVDISVSQVSDDIRSVSPLEVNEASEHEEPEEKGIEINITPSNAKEYVRVHWDQIMRFKDTEKCIKLKEKVSLTKGHVEAFNIGTDIPEDINDAISQTIAEMGKVKKCKNFVANSHALYVYVVVSIFLNEQKTNNQHEQININKNLKTFLNYFEDEIDYIETNTETEKPTKKL